MKKISSLLTFAAILFLCSCSNKPEIEYIPVQLEKDGPTVLMNAKGDVVDPGLSKKERCQEVIDGYFIVRKETDNGFKESVWKMSSKPEELPGMNGFYDIRYLGEDLFAVRKKEESKVDVVNKDGEVLFTLPKKEYSINSAICEGMLRIYTYDEENYESKYGFMDKEGNIVVKPSYTDATDFNEGLAIVGKDEKYSIIDKTGAVVAKLPSSVVPLDGFYFGMARARKGEDSWGFVNHEGEFTKFPAKVDRIRSYNDDYVVVEKDDKEGVMTHDGEVIIRCKYRNVKFLTASTFLCAKDSEKGGYDIMDSDGDRIADLDVKRARSLYDPFMQYTTKFCIIAEDGDHDYMLYNAKGEPVKGSNFYDW
ncbi:MAG: WG repeat-containing protein [Muribaculaceae bacterium]|nr:WG repeat-containing protein [Muribaculaceae bacterium]